MLFLFFKKGSFKNTPAAKMANKPANKSQELFSRFLYFS